MNQRQENNYFFFSQMLLQRTCSLSYLPLRIGIPSARKETNKSKRLSKTFSLTRRKEEVLIHSKFLHGQVIFNSKNSNFDYVYEPENIQKELLLFLIEISVVLLFKDTFCSLFCYGITSSRKIYKESEMKRMENDFLWSCRIMKSCRTF